MSGQREYIDRLARSMRREAKPKGEIRPAPPAWVTAAAERAEATSRRRKAAAERGS